MCPIETRVRSSRKLRRWLGPLYFWTTAFGFDPLRFLRAWRGVPATLRDFFTLRRQNRRSAHPFRIRFTAPCLADRYAPSGQTRDHYFHQDLLIAQRIFARAPQRHVDIGSRIDGFVAHVAAFRPIEVFDIRPLTLDVANITFRQCDLARPPAEFQNYCDSLSCLHTIEHVGLGRYTDTVDVDGYARAFDTLCRVLQSGGMLYLSVPIGPERVDFNAHRCFNIRTILALARGRCDLVDFSYVDDAGDPHIGCGLSEEAIADNCGCYYGCGIFEFRKR
jgi:hypothetical protein